MRLEGLTVERRAVYHDLALDLFRDALEPFALRIAPGVFGEDPLHGGADPFLEGNQRVAEGGLTDEPDDRGGDLFVPGILPRPAQVGIGITQLIEREAQLAC